MQNKQGGVPRSFIRANIEGMGKNVKTDTNNLGGHQSKLKYRFDLLPCESLFAISKTIAEGSKKYGEHNYLFIKTDDHINHALAHVFAYLAGDLQDEHLCHAATRLIMALETDIRKRKRGNT